MKNDKILKNFRFGMYFSVIGNVLGAILFGLAYMFSGNILALIVAIVLIIGTIAVIFIFKRLEHRYIKQIKNKEV